MADVVPDTETVLEFVNKHYVKLKVEAEADNTDISKRDKIITVIKLIDDLLNTVLDTTSTHDTVAGQLKALGVAYTNLKLGDTDAATYTRYKDAFESLSMIVDGLEEVEAGVEGEGEKGSGAEEGAGEGEEDADAG